MDHDPDYISMQLGITPTRTWRIGDPIQGSRLRRKHNGWCLSTDRKQSWDLGQELHSLLDPLESRASEIARVSEVLGLEAEISVAIYVDSATPGMHVDRQLIRSIERLKADFDLDLILISAEPAQRLVHDKDE
jgi:hypothetical protein